MENSCLGYVVLLISRNFCVGKNSAGALQFYKEHEYKIIFLWTSSELAASGHLK